MTTDWQKGSIEITYLVCDVFEAQAGGVERCGLLGVANPEANVIEGKESADCRALGWSLVVYHGLSVELVVKLIFILMNVATLI